MRSTEVRQRGHHQRSIPLVAAPFRSPICTDAAQISGSPTDAGATNFVRSTQAHSGLTVSRRRSSTWRHRALCLNRREIVSSQRVPEGRAALILNRIGKGSCETHGKRARSDLSWSAVFGRAFMFLTVTSTTSFPLPKSCSDRVIFART
jgi:hypothetical protein